MVGQTPVFSLKYWLPHISSPGPWLLDCLRCTAVVIRESLALRLHTTQATTWLPGHVMTKYFSWLYFKGMRKIYRDGANSFKYGVDTRISNPGLGKASHLYFVPSFFFPNREDHHSVLSQADLTADSCKSPWPFQHYQIEIAASLLQFCTRFGFPHYRFIDRCAIPY